MVHDLHPGYLSTIVGEGLGRRARIAVSSPCSITTRTSPPAWPSTARRARHRTLLDGTGYGTDGTIWGGEVLICAGLDSIRAIRASRLCSHARRRGRHSRAVAHGARPFARGRLRCWIAGTDCAARASRSRKLACSRRMIEREFNTPLTSSLRPTLRCRRGRGAGTRRSRLRSPGGDRARRVRRRRAGRTWLLVTRWNARRRLEHAKTRDESPPFHCGGNCSRICAAASASRASPPVFMPASRRHSSRAAMLAREATGIDRSRSPAAACTTAASLACCAPARSGRLSGFSAPHTSAPATAASATGRPSSQRLSFERHNQATPNSREDR